MTGSERAVRWMAFAYVVVALVSVVCTVMWA